MLYREIIAVYTEIHTNRKKMQSFEVFGHRCDQRLLASSCASFPPSVRFPVHFPRTYQRGFQWTEFLEI